MINIRIHIKNNFCEMDSDVSCLIQLPSVPRVGDIVRLSITNIIELENKAKELGLDYLIYYAPKWFYGESCNIGTPTKDNLKDFSFDDAIYVSQVEFISDYDIVNIQLDNEC